MTQTATATETASDRQRMAIDNLIRRELKVGDPHDPEQIAQALADRYQFEARAQAIGGEAQGLPFLRAETMRPSAPPAPTATSVDLDTARRDVGIDLAELLSDNLNKDIRPELEGWQSVIHRSIDEGVAAARFGLDPRQRDKAFAMRRQLGDYARLARMVGVLTPTLNRSFRNLAQSIDEACAVILVLMGESMANLGFAGGRFLLQAPYSELQARRDAVLTALRQLDGVSAMAMQPNAWPRGLRAYRQLSTALEAKGQGDLRSLMNEAELSRAMDEMVGLASGGSPSGLRALGATAWAPLSRLHRFVQTTLRPVAPASPELATLHEALQLFIDGFVPAGGFRLLRVARPTVLNYGLYGSARVDKADDRLIDLVNHRGSLARLLDCLADCECDKDMSLARIILDSVLYNLDRSIDFYCVGDGDFGLPEARAAACSYLIDAVQPASWAGWRWREYLLNPGPPVDHPVAMPALVNNIQGALGGQVNAELLDIRRLLRPDAGGAHKLANWDITQAEFEANLAANVPWLGTSAMNLFLGDVMRDELCLQRTTDLEWRAVIEQMTSGCIDADAIFKNARADRDPGALPLILDRALDFISAATTIPATGERLVPANSFVDDPQLPAHFEESLLAIERKL
ncbi:hypothetical protein [Cupriavidus necator]